ncbi:MAG: DivIVA domain-containing protein [Clostridia bacterium]|nr:DivIVA domain-containing protein [Clostridia bacterium]
MYTPIELENISFKKSAFGYDKDEVLEFLETISRDYDKLYKENLTLKDKNNMLSNAIKEYKSMEDALRDTVVTAHSISDEVKKNAHKEAENIIKEANLQKDEMLAKANREIEAIQTEITSLKQEFSIYKSKIKSLIHSQIEILELDK